ncbi:PepSY-like domain-containing protein [Zunongwangia sp. H14]|uniref:PepSY-like domain-containing protein n=1 Tax=Zunongwangia sp. H14 TaxID=3240792 RepID=UPI003567C93D
MKILKVAVLALFATTAVNAQDLTKNEIPSKLMSKFEKEYSNVKDVEWEMEGENYKVEFDKNRREHQVWYSRNGNMVKLEKEIGEDELPASISGTINNKYSGYKIDSIEMTEEGNKKTFEIELEKGWTNEKTVIFDESGSVIKEWED